MATSHPVNSTIPPTFGDEVAHKPTPASIRKSEASTVVRTREV